MGTFLLGCFSDAHCSRLGICVHAAAKSMLNQKHFAVLWTCILFHFLLETGNLLVMEQLTAYLELVSSCSHIS